MSFCPITSEVEILLSRIPKRRALMAPQKGLRIRWAGSIIPGGHRPDPSLSRLRSVPYNTHILLLRVCLVEYPSTDGAVAVR